MRQKKRRKKGILAICIACVIITTNILAITAWAAETYQPQQPCIYGVVNHTYYQGRDVNLSDGIFASGVNGCRTSILCEYDKTVPGEYPVIYRVEGAGGFTVEKYATLTILPSGGEASEEDAQSIAKQILDAIISDEMTDYEKCRAVYDYLHSIAYTGTVYPNDYLDAAYKMLAYRSGDCFGYYSASKLLLEMLGFWTMKVENNDGFTHVWCMVSTDKGQTWYHFDPTCWSWGSDGYLCMVSDDELAWYGSMHMTGGVAPSHGWDRSNYPQTPAVGMYAVAD